MVGPSHGHTIPTRPKTRPSVSGHLILPETTAGGAKRTKLSAAN